MSKSYTLILFLAVGTTLETRAAGPVSARAPELALGSSWTVMELTGPAAPGVGGDFASRTFWDLRPPPGVPSRLLRWEVLQPADSGLERAPGSATPDRALCLEDVSSGARLGCLLVRASETGPAGPHASASDLKQPAFGVRASAETVDDSLEVGETYREAAFCSTGPCGSIDGRAVAEGLALTPAGPREVVLVREDVPGELSVRYRFLDRGGIEVARLQGRAPGAGQTFVVERAEVLVAQSPRADNGIEIPYTKLHQALQAGRTGFLQYSQENDIALTSIHPGWTSVIAMRTIDETSVSYQPDPSDPGSLQSLPEVWDFTGLVSANLTYRTFNTTRDDLAGNACGESCAARNTGPSPPDGTWQSYLKIDNYEPGGTLLTRDLFDINDNDTGVNPAIDVPYVAQDELNSENRTQICFAQSAGGAERFLHLFRFTGASPATAVLGVSDTWTSGAWTSCNDASGLRLTAASVCGASACYPSCGTPLPPRARGLLVGGAGFRMTILEDGYVHVPAGNYVPGLLMLQEADLQASVNFGGTCNVSPVHQRAFDYFWLNDYYGLLALVSSPNHDTMPADNWSAVGNVSDGADFTWGPYPPYQFLAQACLAGTRVSWALPVDGSNLNGEPGVADYGYVVSWGSLADPSALADWAANPNHTPLPGEAGYLAAPDGSEPTSFVITTWPGPSINATVTTALRYTDPDVGDQRAYRSAAFYKVTENRARLDAATFRVGPAVAPFVHKSGSDLVLSWPAVPGAASYLVRVWDLATDAEIPCPGGLDCAPAAPTTRHAGAALDGNHYGYKAFAVDPCGGISAD